MPRVKKYFKTNISNLDSRIRGNDDYFVLETVFIQSSIIFK